jgi:hypothetical protein
MRNFKICYPDANTFDKVIKLIGLDKWELDFVKLDKDLGYWVGPNPFLDNGFDLFQEVVAAFPIQKDNNHPDNVDPNPFDTIHLPEWCYKDFCFLLRDFYIKIKQPEIFDPQIHEWGNVYIKERARPISCWRIPHVDYAHGMVCNLWFTDHAIEDSGTKLYRYHGTMHKELYDFQIQENHPLHERWRSVAENPKRADSWFNMSDKELADWNFEYIGIAPTKKSLVTCYFSDTHHSAYISDKVDFRWSHAFAFSHEKPKDFYMRDFFK